MGYLCFAIDAKAEVVAGKVAVDFHFGAYFERHGHLQADTVFAEVDQPCRKAADPLRHGDCKFQPLHRRPF